jgi:hypothetical protein
MHARLCRSNTRSAELVGIDNPFVRALQGCNRVGTVIVQLVPAALGVAISPFPITAAILMLFSTRATLNGLAFLAGWVLGLMLLTTVALRLVNAGKVSGDGASSMTAPVAACALGALLVVMGVWEWTRRPKHDEQPPTPRWLAGVSGFTTVKAFGLALVLSAVNPKSLALAVAAALTISAARLTGDQSWIALLIFVVLGSLSIAIPVLYRLFASEHAEKRLTAWKNWLITNNAAVMSALLVIVGFALVGKGFIELAG